MVPHNPVRAGVIEQVDVLAEIYAHGFGHLTGNRGADPGDITVDRPVLLADPIPTPLAVRKELVEHLFETYECPSTYFGPTALMACYASARYTGLVVESGAGYSAAVPIHEGYVLRRNIQTTSLGGDTITDLLEQRLMDRHPTALRPAYTLTPPAPDRPAASVDLPGVTPEYHAMRRRWLVEDIKACVCDVPDVPMDDSTDPVTPAHYGLPDGTVLTLGNERMTIPEVLFNPSLLDRPGSRCTAPSIQSIVVKAVGGSDESIQKGLYQNVLPVGGTTALPSFNRRLAAEIDSMKLPVYKTKVHHYNTEERDLMAFTGASILASLGTFHQLWLSRAEYAEHGAEIVATKFM